MHRRRSGGDVLAVTTAPRRLASILLGTALLVPALMRTAAAGEGAFAPPDSAQTRRGWAVAERFSLARRFVLTLDVANAFSAQNQAAMARAEARVAAVPGVRQVIGPARLLTFTIDGAARVTAAPLRAHEPVAPAVRADTTMRADAVARAEVAIKAQAAETERLLGARADATGWFISSDGSAVRILIDTADPAGVHGRVEAAVAGSGLVLLDGKVGSSPLWPDPERDATGFGRRAPLEWALLLLAVPFLAVVIEARPVSRRAWLCVLGAAITTALPGSTAPVAGLRWYAVKIGGIAAALLIAVLLLDAGLRRLRGKERPAVPGRRAPLPLVVLSVLALAGAAVQARRLRMDTGLWSQTPLFFVDVRADLSEPVVLRELRRLTDLLRAQPGVDEAWSVADLFGAVPLPDLGWEGIPSEPQATRAILKRALADPAVGLETAPDLLEGLIVIRVDGEAGLTPAQVRRGVTRLLRTRGRPALLRVDVNDPALPHATRALARGMLAEGAIERVLNLCDQAGRNLEPRQQAAIEQTLRRVALAPQLDRTQYRRDAAQEIERFVEETAVAGRHLTLPHAGQRQRLIDAVLASPDEPMLADVLSGLNEVLGPRASARVALTQATELRRRLIVVRRRAIVAWNARAILSDADLPTEGGLPDQVRNATLEAMGPIVGVPVAPGTPGAIPVDAAVAGGVISDEALSARWPPRLRLGLLAAAAACALLLAALGGRRALSWLPVALAPAAIVLIVPTVLGVATSALFAAVLSGAVGGGTVFALAYAPARGEGARGG